METAGLRTGAGRYVVDLTREQLEGAPTYSDANVWEDPAYGRQVDQYYGPFSGI
jgi:hypothetical protein